MEQFMKRAIKIAKKSEGLVSPNPLVGALLVKDGVIIAEGYHMKYGEAHAEVNAIRNIPVGVDFEELTLYVTLEPCCHYGKTPPCTELIIEKGIRKVVVGALDPNPLVAGKGIEILRDSGVEVITGVLNEECTQLNEVFNKYILEQIPFIYLKAGISLDGKIALANGESKWITSEKMRNDSMKWRNKVKGIMVGINTVINDNPALTCRVENGVNPIRIVVDSNLRIPMNSQILNDSNETIIATKIGSNNKKRSELIAKGIKVLEIKEDHEGRVDLKSLIIELGKLNIDSILIEGGGTLNFQALNTAIVDKVILYIAPKIIGGKDSITFIEGAGVSNVNYGINLENIKVSNFDKGLYLECEVGKCSQE